MTGPKVVVVVGLTHRIQTHYLITTLKQNYMPLPVPEFL